MGRTACTEPQCLYKGDLYLFFVPQYPVYVYYAYLTTQYTYLVYMSLILSALFSLLAY